MVAVDTVNQILEKALAEISSSGNLQSLDELRVRFLGKYGAVVCRRKDIVSSLVSERDEHKAVSFVVWNYMITYHRGSPAGLNTKQKRCDR